jgi:hypothetical protein
MRLFPVVRNAENYFAPLVLEIPRCFDSSGMSHIYSLPVLAANPKRDTDRNFRLVFSRGPGHYSATSETSLQDRLMGGSAGVQ